MFKEKHRQRTKEYKEYKKINVWKKWEYQKRKIVKRNQTEILELKSKITEIKNSLEEFNSRSEQVEEQMMKLETWQLKLLRLRSRNLKRMK